jgi:hypothetical protein
VLHHLESTEAGLAALAAVLKDDGAIFLMLYGKYGRRAVYDMQALLRTYLPAGATRADKVRLARGLLAALPKTNSFLRDLAAWSWEISPEGFGDAGLYDLLLHSQDRCFDVPGVYALAASAGLHLLGFAWRSADYEPANLVSDPAVRALLSPLDLPARQALAELFVGNLSTHEFFLARQPDRGARLTDRDNALRSYGALLFAAPRLAAEMERTPGGVLRLEDRGVTLDIDNTPMSRIIYAHMDGRTSIHDLREKIMHTVPGATPEATDQALESVYSQLHPRGLLYLIRAGDYGLTVPDYERLFTTRPP